MGSYVRKKIEYLVVDTSAFLNKAAVQEIGENILTVPQVIEEIKSKRQLRRLVVLPYDLSVKEAFPENIKFVIEFSKKTGDYASLSVADLNVIALTYQLEKEKNGINHLNNAPVSRPSIQSTATIPKDLKKIIGFYVPKKVLSAESEVDSKCDSAEDERYDSAEEEQYDSAEDREFDNSVKEKHVSNGDTQPEQILENDFKNIKLDDEKNAKTDNEGQERDSNETRPEKEDDYEDKSGESEEDEDEDENDDDDDSHWITPSNLERAKIQIAGELNEDYKNINVACLTKDFAMQNVLKQIGLNIISVDGKVIKQLRTFILRCYGCFKTTSVMTKIFCPNCGNKTLKKVAVSFDENGAPRIHINFRKPLTARGKRYSLPRFKGGKHSNNPIICEDQPMPQQRSSRLSRTKNDPLNDDYIAGYSPFVTRDVTSKSAMLGIKPHLEIKHWMRKNPNESRKKKK